MADSPENEPMLDIAHGDAALSKHLRNSLNVLRGKVDDPEFKKMVDDVMSGKVSLRDVASSSVFSRALDPYAQQAAEKFENMTEEECEELARAGEAQFEEMRKAEKANAKRQSRASMAEEDDEDFSERSWLE